MSEIKIIKADTCSPSDSVASIAKKMQQKKIRRLYVTDKNKKLLGVVTTVDIINKIVASQKDAKKTPVSKIMTKNVRSINISQNLDECLAIMNNLKTFVCPVVDKEKLIGIVSYQNIIASVITASRK